MTKPIPTPDPPKKTRSAAVRAATAYNKVQALQTECEREIANAPESIRERYDYRILKLRTDLDDEVRVLLDKLLGGE